MKAIQVSIDENLLGRLDSYPEVCRWGRSAVIREAVAAYLAQQEAQAMTAEEIDRAYEEAYRAIPPDEFDSDWATVEVWLD